jgi:flagellar biosynthesis protein FliP
MIFATPPVLLDVTALTQTPLQFSSTISLLLSLSAISLIPFFLISATSFLRITIVLGMIRSAMGTQQSPPNAVIISLALFMTIFIMSPVWTSIHTQAVMPYNQKQITQEVAFQRAMDPLRDFMFKQVREKDLSLFLEFANLENIKVKKEIPTYVLVPAFTLSELRSAFAIAFIIFLPFVLVDLLVANILLSLGMMMLSPVMVSLPFKILLFVLVDGFNLIIRGLMISYQ